MRAIALHGDELALCLADVGDLADVAARLGFERSGMVFSRRFPGDAPYAAQAAARFEECAEAMVRQAADLDAVAWEEALETLLEHPGWMLVGSAARAIRGEDAAPHDLDLVSDTEGCDRLAAALADRLIEPLVDGGWIGARWFRAFGPARIECVGDFAGEVVDEDTVVWRGHEVRVGRIR